MPATRDGRDTLPHQHHQAPKSSWTGDHAYGASECACPNSQLHLLQGPSAAKNVYYQRRQLVIPFKGKLNKFVLAPTSRYFRDTLRRDGKDWRVDEGQPQEAAYTAEPKRGKPELPYLRKEADKWAQQVQSQLRQEEATKAHTANGKGKSSAPTVPIPTCPTLKGLPVGIDPKKTAQKFQGRDVTPGCRRMEEGLR